MKTTMFKKEKKHSLTWSKKNSEYSKYIISHFQMYNIYNKLLQTMSQRVTEPKRLSRLSIGVIQKLAAG